MTELVAVARAVLAIVFVVSAVAKLRDRSGSRGAVAAFGIPDSVAPLVAALLPVVELACAALLVLGDPAATLGAIASLVLLAAFTTAIVVNLLRGRRPACHCFGSLGDESEVGWDTVARNAAFMALAALSFVGAGSQSTVWSVAADVAAGKALLWAGGVLLVTVIAVLAFVVQTLMRRYGEVLLRLEAIEVVVGLAEHPEAPEIRLPDLDGVEVTLRDTLDAERPVLVAFVSPSCANCTELLPDLEQWQAEPDRSVEVMVLSDGTVDDNRAKLADAPDLRVLLQPDRSLFEILGVVGTPAAVLVSADGRLVGPPAHGAADIQRMYASIVPTGSASPSGHDHVHQIERRPVSPGDPAPQEVALTTESGEEWAIAEAMADDPVLLFWRFDCGFCEQIVDDVRALEDRLPLRIVTSSTTEAIRATGLTSTILRDHDGELETWLRIPGTPSAVRIRAGEVDSPVVVGGPEVLALLEAAAFDLASERERSQSSATIG